MEYVKIQHLNSPEIYTFKTRIDVKEGDYVYADTQRGESVGIVKDVYNFSVSEPEKYVVGILTKDEIEILKIRQEIEKLETKLFDLEDKIAQERGPIVMECADIGIDSKLFESDEVL